MKKRHGRERGWRSMVAVAAGAFVLAAAPLHAQGAATRGDSAYSTTTTTTQQPEHHGFPWGLLGLLGLAGLLGRRRPEVTQREEIHARPAPRVDDVRVHPGTPLGGTSPADDLRVRPDDPAGPRRP